MDKRSLVRLVIFILAWVNVWLAKQGLTEIPLNEEFIAYALTFGISAWGFWKNNYISYKGKLQKEALAKEKLG